MPCNADFIGKLQIKLIWYKEERMPCVASKEFYDIRNFTIFKFVLVITAIFVFLSGCERVPQVLEPTTPPVKDSRNKFP